MLDEKDVQIIRALLKEEIGTSEERRTENIKEKKVLRSRVDDLEDEVKFLKSVVRQINEDVQTLKRAT